MQSGSIDSELSWSLQDYLDHGEEPPERLVDNPESCEGQLMSDDEVLAFVKDGVATIMILRDKGSDRTEAVHDVFLNDCLFLLSLGRLELDEYNELIDLENYSF